MSKLLITKTSVSVIMILLLSGCATYKVQKNIESLSKNDSSKKPVHTFYIAGGIGNTDNENDEDILKLLESHLIKADEKSTLLFTGDNISEKENNWATDKLLLTKQVQLAKSFKGKTVFMPGNNSWKSYNTKQIEEVEDYIKGLDIDNVEVLPNNVCPIDRRVISDDLDLLLVDSKWFISNWSRVKNINKKCTDVVTRRRFMEELEGYINDGQGKNIVIAMHHPIFSNGRYAGKYSFKESLAPLPGLGLLVNSVKNLGAFSPDLLDSRRYNYMRIAVSSLAKASDRITIVSGHEESLQYLTGGNIHQIISGSLNDKSPTKRSKEKITTIGGSLDYEGKFTYGEKGFSILTYFDDGSSEVTFVTNEDKKYSFPVLSKMEEKNVKTDFPKVTSRTKKNAVLEDPKALNKSGFYTFLWGERYRKYFGKSVTAPVAMLDTLYGGLKVTKKGGGHQSYSIRLEDENGKEYSMRSLRKNALKFLKFKIPGIAYTEDDYDGTFTKEVISDFFTTAHPYMQLVINPLAKSVNVNHSSPSLFYVPKQENLGDLNKEFGNELYFIEERPSEEQMNFKGYKRAIDEAGKIKDFESTTDMLEKIKSDESYSVAERDFIRARLFDMLIGDWDRHQDQWRWVEYEKKDGDKEFLPVPRDRDNAFPKFDGNAMKLVKVFVPTSRRWQSYGPEIKSEKWLNIGGNKIDRAILTRFGTEAWEKEAKFIQENLSDKNIENAFAMLPKEVQDQTSEEIKNNLKKRLKDLPKYAKSYSNYLNKVVALHGTEKDDKFEITRLPDGKTKVIIKRLLKDDPNEIIYERIFDRRKTKEIWVYGLGDDDEFEVSGKGKNRVFVRLIGGYGEDKFKISNTKSVRVYDWIHEDIKFEEKKPSNQLTDVYKTNTFHWRFFEENSTILTPNLGFRTDDGFFLGAKNIHIHNGFNGSPFRQKHSISANYYFNFKAADISYKGIWTNIMPKWNFELDGYYASDQFSNNFFGIGNETVNNEDNTGRDFYRSRMQIRKVSAGIAYHTLRFRGLYEGYTVKQLGDRFFTPDNLDENVFESQNYVGAETSLRYYNNDAKDFPTKSIDFGLLAGYKLNTALSENRFGYLAFNTSLSYKLIQSGNLVLSSKAEVRTNFGDNYFFYHAPSLGGNNGLRGFRDERFSGKTYFYQTSDLRLRIKRYMTAVAPITIGMYGGFDYGRVWTENDTSNVWHTSQGLGFWASGFNFLSFNAGYFNSVEGNLVQVGFGFQF